MSASNSQSTAAPPLRQEIAAAFLKAAGDAELPVVVTVAPEWLRIAAAALSETAPLKVYQCPRCGTGMEEDPSAKHSAYHYETDRSGVLPKEKIVFDAPTPNRAETPVPSLGAPEGFDEWIARELPRATGVEIDQARFVWESAQAPVSATVPPPEGYRFIPVAILKALLRGDPDGMKWVQIVMHAPADDRSAG